MDLIDRQVLLKNARIVCDHIRGCNYGCCSDCAGDTFVEMIENAPTVDAVEVVRCKDCRFSMLWRKPQDAVIGECYFRKMYSTDEQFPLISENDFCSVGRKRSDEENAKLD